MRVSDLIEALQKEDPLAWVVMSSDGEGNSYSPLASIEEGAYREESTYSGEFGLSALTPDLEKQGYGEDDVFEIDGDTVHKAVALWPTN